MRAFISYSLVDRDQYIISLLSNRLRADGYSLLTSTNLYSNIVDFTTTQQIYTSQLFIGIISSNGAQRNRVLQEWQQAVANRVPAVLLIEQGIPIASGTDPNTYIIFNRHNPQLAIEKIRERMKSKSTDVEEAAGWVLAGAALLAILSLFSGSKK